MEQMKGSGRKQQQFLEVLDRDAAEARWREVVGRAALSSERVLLASALGRVLAEDVRAEVDVPGFDRSASQCAHRIPLASQKKNRFGFV
jgi:hypothetical protein